jgi:hypothetical protein
MSKKIIVSFDDIFQKNDKWEEFKKIKEEIPEFKVTLFVITRDDKEYWDTLKTDWTELVFHSYEHGGEWLKWTVEEAEKWLKYYHELGFAKGFKAPGWHMTENICKAINNLDFWVCTCKNQNFIFKNRWITLNQGLEIRDDYVELWGHTQDTDFDIKIQKLKEYLKTNKGTFKFISEVINTNG